MRIPINLFLFLTVIFFSNPALASTVTTTADSGPGSLRAAISNAAPGEVIDFAVSGTITLTSGELLINKGFTITGPGAANLTIQRSVASGTAGFRIFNIQPGAVGGVISGLTVSNGRAVSGAGINNEATFVLRDCVITGNTASESGGGIFNGGDGALSITNCVVRENSVIGNAGASYGGGFDNAGTAVALSCLISSNAVTGGTGVFCFGGGVNNDGTLAITNSVIEDNSASATTDADGIGGGIFNEGTLTVHTTTIRSNLAMGGSGTNGFGEGGGIGNRFGKVTLVRSTVSGNLAVGQAGAGIGSGIFNGEGTVIVDNSTISGNAASSTSGQARGGGFANDSGPLTLRNSTVTANVVPAITGFGSGADNANGIVELKNSILAGNRNSSDFFNGGSASVNSGGFNLIGTTDGLIAPGPSDQFNVTAAVLRVGALQDNGGPTFTHSLLCGSPAINAGDNTNAPPTDQRGFPRIVSGVIDIGSFESDNTSPTIACSGSTTSNCAPPTGQPVTVSVNVADGDGDRLTVVWHVDGTSYQTNTVPAGQPPATNRVDFTAVFGVGPHVISVSVTDPYDCAATCTTTITVIADRSVPSINCLGNKTNECGAGSLVFDTPTAGDDCGAVVISVLNTVTNLGCGNTFVATRTWVATDGAGNTNTCRQTIASIDTTAPVLTCPSNLTVNCATQVPVPNTNSVTAIDGCGGAVAVSWQTDAISTSNCVGQFVITRTYRATDLCGNSATCAQTITVQDTNPPSIICPSNLTVSCAGQVPAPNTNSVTAIDGCGGAVTVSWQTDAISTSNCVGQFIITRTYRATDQCGNSATCAQTITVQDTNPPSIICPSNLTVSCSSQVPAPNTNGVTASDGCGGAVTVSWQTDAISTSNCVGRFVLTRIYRATDQCGNSATCAQTITVQDTNPPSIICPSNLTVSCASQVPAPNTNSVTASDGCGGAVTVSWQTDSISTSNCVGQFVITRTYRATDLCGNSATCAQTITVQDTNPPSITCPSNLTVSCASQVPAPNTNGVTASDGCGGAVTVSWQTDSISTSNCIGQFVITRTYRATDLCGNSATCAQTITVQDTNPPSITCPSNLTVSCAGQVPAPNTNGVTASDGCGGAVAVSWQSDSISTSNCIGQFVLTRTYRATDLCGNSATCAQTITVQDTNPPSIICPSNVTVSCAGQVPAPNTNSVTANDGCGGAVTVSWQTDAISTSNCVGQFVITRTYRATDLCGNSATCAQTITVQDTNPPSITCPSNLTVSCAGQVPAPNTNGVTANDGCGGAVTVGWQTDAISTSNCVGQFVITRTYRATDQCGNSATCAQTITVQDTNPPSIICPSNLTVSCASQVPAPNTNSVTANDGCGGAVTVSWQTDSISTSNCVGQFVITRTYRATDLCGNSATCAQTITIQDTNPPSISCSDNKTNQCGVSGLAFDTPAVSDGCGSATLSILSTVTNLTSDGRFIATRTWVANDPCGNTSSCSQTIVALVNGTAPTIICVSPVIVNCASATGTVATVSANVADADGDPLTVVWTVDGRPAQTNTVPAGGPPTTGRVDFAAVFTVGTHQISVTVFDSGCDATCTTTVTINPSAIGDLYPIALHIDSLTGVPVGGIIADIYNGVQPGNFGWLTWAGSPNEPTIVTSLTPPGNSSTYVNPRNRNDHTVSIGDLVQGKPGVTNSDKVRKALDTLKQIDIVVPVWDRAIGRGNNSLYRVVRFARVRITDYRLPKQNRITARFLGFVDCQ